MSSLRIEEQLSAFRISNGFCRETPFDGSELHSVNEDLATIDFDLQILLLAVADSLTELLEFDEDGREIILQVGEQPEFDLFDHVAGSEEQDVAEPFDFDPLVRLD